MYTQRGAQELMQRVHVPLGWPRRMFVASLGLFFLSIVAYIGLEYGYKTFLTRSWQNTEKELADLGSQVEPTTQENFIIFRSQIENLKVLLLKHVAITNFFPFIEGVTHMRTTYQSFDLSVAQRELKLTGVTESYETLASQIKLYEDSPMIKDVTLEQSAVNGGSIKFSVKLVLSDDLFKINNTVENTEGTASGSETGNTTTE